MNSSLILKSPSSCLAHRNSTCSNKRPSHVRIDMRDARRLSLAGSGRAKRNHLGRDNVFKKFWSIKETSMTCCPRLDFVVEGEYEPGAQEQLYMNNGAIARHNSDDGVTVWGSDAVSFTMSTKSLIKLFVCPKRKFVPRDPTETGRRLRGKEAFFDDCRARRAGLAWKSGLNRMRLFTIAP